MTAPVRLQLSRRRGFDLQALSNDVNGLPAASVTRRGIGRGLFGNPFKVTSDTPAKDAVRFFRGFLCKWSDERLVNAPRYAEDRSWAPMAGIGLVVTRNYMRANLHALRGRNLACFCSPDSPCHADVLLDLLATDWPDRWKAKYPRICDEVR